MHVGRLGVTCGASPTLPLKLIIGQNPAVVQSRFGVRSEEVPIAAYVPLRNDVVYSIETAPAILRGAAMGHRAGISQHRRLRPRSVTAAWLMAQLAVY